ncbi:MAG: hypothetical protein MR868_11640 [Lachnospiraceae bacterium]|nr:hypothetical protein [Lachnospiraceae bacterium]
MMREHSRYQRNGRETDGHKHLLPVVIIPLVVIILMIVIVVVDRGRKDGKTTDAEPIPPSMTETEQIPADSAQEETAGADSPETEEGIEETMAANLQKDEVPEILSLMETYFRARAAGDAETMNQLYGISGLSVSALEAEKTRMRSNSKYVRGFENITTYVKDGLEADSWLVYTTCDIRFHSVETAAPMIMWCYVTKDAEGNYRILDQDELSPEMQRYVDEMNRTEEVRSLASDVNGRLKDALMTDEDLNEVYGILRDGSPVYQQENETDAVQILETQAEAEMQAEAETQAEAQ